MNYWITLILPLIILNIIFRIIQYLFSKSRRDVTLVYIILTLIQLSLTTILVMVINKLGFGALMYWLLIVTIVSTFFHVAFDDNHFNLRINKENSLIISSIISTLAIFATTYLIIF